MPLTLEQANNVIDGAVRRAAELELAVSVVVVDESGSPRALARMDGAAPLSVRIAEAKASGAAEFLRTGEQMAGINEHREAFFRAASSLARLPLIPVAGSIVVHREGVPTGAVGVSGGSPEQDLECAQAGVATLG
jgi:uncharacterized protein GlcG (DUF336 family)